MPSRLWWWYCAAVLALWAVDPEIRRLLEWHGSFHAFRVLAVVPLLATVPFFFSAFPRGRISSAPMLLLAWTWLGGFAYAAVMGWLFGQHASALYDFLQFTVPISIALWISVSGENVTGAFNRISTILLAIAVPVSLYGIVQYVMLPGWDAVWLQHVQGQYGMVTNGAWLPFEVRVFSTLNSPVPCAVFLATAFAFNLHRLKERSLLAHVAMFLCIVTLALTLVRSAWIALAVAAVVYLLLSGRPVRTAAVVAAFAVTVAVFFYYVSPWLAMQAGKDNLALRLQTFFSLQSDSSVNSRTATTEELLRQGIDEPLGQGLGLSGPAAEVSGVTSTADAVDGGFQARFSAMGFTGFGAYVATLLLAFGFTLGKWWKAKGSGDRDQREIMAVLMAVQALLVVMDFSVDSHAGFPGVLCWLAVGIALKPQTETVPEPATELAGSPA
jgi:putative inorganic carbon (HCO3(-)) transporter